jgi:hypothetical protein
MAQYPALKPLEGLAMNSNGVSAWLLLSGSCYLLTVVQTGAGRKPFLSWTQELP